ncbi:uncharacterized protein [Haliotis asinina]|uniref:uncharacterized protein n=1 Tax=Haliotis asinina TaxID=109174 RepID=UPI0035322869
MKIVIALCRRYQGKHWREYWSQKSYQLGQQAETLLLVLSRGQAQVEGGFSVNKEVEVENLKEVTLKAQRIYVIESGHPTATASLSHTFTPRFNMLFNSVVEAVVVGIFLGDVSVSVPTPSATQQDACVDHYPTCQSYKGWGCGGQYEEWASYNCAKTCGLCDKKGSMVAHSTNIPLTVTHPVQPCRDRITNCKEYGLLVCTDKQFEVWSRSNCASYCQLCDSNTCKDRLSSCASYDREACGGQYTDWAKDNCAKTCSLCDV